MYLTCLDERGQMINVMPSGATGSDHPQSLGRPADEMEIGRVGVGGSGRDDHAGCR
jgi:hypothetical protein